MTTTNAMERVNGGPLLPTQHRPAQLAGEESTDFILPRIHIFQGLPLERKLYPGDFREGDLINTITLEKMEAKNFIPLFGWKEWIKWREPRGNGIEYRGRDKSKLPPQDVTWKENTPPAATEYINWCVLFEGQVEPICLSFSRTMLTAGKNIFTVEKMRGRRGMGLYAFDLKKRSNAKGEWLVPSIRPVGDPEGEHLETAIMLRDSIDPNQVSVQQDEANVDSDIG